MGTLVNILTALSLLTTIKTVPPTDPGSKVITDIVGEVLTSPPVFGLQDQNKDFLPDTKDKRKLYSNYYKASPDAFLATGTRYGSLDMAIGELVFYKDVLNQQMWRGYVLLASGDYGYHPELLEKMQKHVFERYGIITKDDLLDNQSAPMYLYFADRKIDERNQPVSVRYSELNERQRNLYRILNGRIDDYFVNVRSQKNMTPLEAIESGKYIGAVAGKSPNDIGREFLFFKDDSFLGVVLVFGSAKRADWTGTGGVTNSVMENNPLGTRFQNGQQWGFDLTDELYYELGGNGGPAYNIVAVDVEYYLSVLQ